MRERGDRAGFAFEALAVFDAPRGRVREHLEGDGTTESGIAGAVDLTHAAFADEGFDGVGA
jgi:hypothetical protein